MGQISIREKGITLFEKAYGMPDANNATVVSPNSVYKIGSVTKIVTSVMVLQLIEEKKLTLNTKLLRFFPEISQADRITIDDLLHHRSGIKDYVNADTTLVKNQFSLTKKDILKAVGQYEPLFEPATKFEYSNSNYFLLALIIEKITQKSYEENVQKRIIQPLQLQNTFVKLPQGKESVPSYLFLDKKWNEQPKWHPEFAFGSGDIISTATDLTLLMEGVFEGKLLKPSSIKLMTTLKDSYGKGLMTFPFGERRFYGHTGGIEAYRSVVGYYPSEQLGISLIVNGDNYNRNDIMIGVLSIFYKMPYRFPQLQTLEIDTAILQSYDGVYSSKALPIQLKITTKEGVLCAQATGQSSFELTAIAKDTFVFEPAVIQIKFFKNGFQFKQGGAVFEFVKNETN